MILWFCSFSPLFCTILHYFTLFYTIYTIFPKNRLAYEFLQVTAPWWKSRSDSDFFYKLVFYIYFGRKLNPAHCGPQKYIFWISVIFSTVFSRNRLPPTCGARAHVNQLLANRPISLHNPFLDKSWPASANYSYLSSKTRAWDRQKSWWTSTFKKTLPQTLL